VEAIMRSTLLTLTLGLGVLAASLAPAAACQYQPTSAANDQASPPQTADAQPAQPAQPAQSDTN
jgi:hypothetical protein